MIKLRIRRTGIASLPAYQSAQAAGLDIQSNETFILAPGERRAVSTGLEVEIPEGYEGQIRSRSGLAAKYGIVVLNSPGTIDSDYRGEVKVILFNHGKESIGILHGDRIAQLVIAPVTRVEVEEVEKLSETKRGNGGLGSTGVRETDPILLCFRCHVELAFNAFSANPQNWLCFKCANDKPLTQEEANSAK